MARSARVVLPELPRVVLLDGPTPLQPLPRFAAALGGRADIWIKREDLGPLAFSGNKLRNLEFLLGAALADGAGAVVTSGRRWSNHCRLAAAAGSKLGLGVHVVISGPPLPSPNVELIRLLGGTIHQAATDDREERERLVDQVSRELAEQLEHASITADAIVVASATGGTQAGLLVGAQLAFGQAPRVIGVVASQGAAALREAIEPKVRELAAMAGIEPPVDRVELDDRQLGQGYGIPTAASQAATELLARTEGILVDPIYTAKALAAIVDGVRSGELGGRRLVFWHGGGLPSLFEASEPPS